MKKMTSLLSLLLIATSILFADDRSEVLDVLNNHWKYQNAKDWRKYVETLHSEGTMNGDSNGSFWYKRESTVAAVTEGSSLADKYNFKPRYIEIDILEKDRVAIAYYYLVGSYTISDVKKSDYRTRVSQIFVKEAGAWKVKAGHYTPLHSGSGIPD